MILVCSVSLGSQCECRRLSVLPRYLKVRLLQIDLCISIVSVRIKRVLSENGMVIRIIGELLWLAIIASETNLPL